MSRPLIVAASLALAACNSTAPKSAAPADAPLAGTRWQVTHVGALAAQSETEAPGWLQIQADQVEGHTGCNGLSGTATLAGTALSFGPIAITKRYCPRSAAIETALLDALGKTQGARVTATTLELLDAEGSILVRLQASPQQP